MPNRQRAFCLAVAVIVTFGVLVRVLGMFDPHYALWGDEASWATLFRTQHFWDMEKRPVGYVLLTRFFLLFSDAEWMWRLPSYLAGIAVMGVFVLIGRALEFGIAAQLFMLLACAFNPQVIEFSKEFKPYSLELCLHAIFVYLAIRALLARKPESSAHRAFLVLAPLALLVANNLIFVLPLIYAFAWFTTWPAKARKAERVRLRFSILAFANVAMLLAWILAEAVQHQIVDYWGRRYGVFCPPDYPGGRLFWYFRKTWEMAAYDLMPRSFLGVPEKVTYYAAGFLCFAGLICLLRRKRYRLAALLMVPWSCTLIANALGHWPYGGFRTNLFIGAYTIVLAGFAIDTLARASYGRYLASAFVGVWAIVAWPYQPGYYYGKTHSPTQTFNGLVYYSRTPEILREMDRQLHHEERKPEKPMVVTDWWGSEPLRYYLHHSRRMGDLSPELMDLEAHVIILDPVEVAEGTKRFLETEVHRPLWMLIGHAHLAKVEKALHTYGLPVSCQAYEPQVLCRIR